MDSRCFSTSRSWNHSLEVSSTHLVLVDGARVATPGEAGRVVHDVVAAADGRVAVLQALTFHVTHSTEVGRHNRPAQQGTCGYSHGTNFLG